MGFLAILKLLGFILWPALIFIPYLFTGKENFKKKFKQMIKPPN